jgi:glutamyl-tRNA reductase
VELAMRDIPVKVRDIRARALDKVFAKELETLDPASRAVLEKVIDYMEKKYISVPMKMAREIIIGIKN